MDTHAPAVDQGLLGTRSSHRLNPQLVTAPHAGPCIAEDGELLAVGRNDGIDYPIRRRERRPRALPPIEFVQPDVAAFPTNLRADRDDGAAIP